MNPTRKPLILRVVVVTFAVSLLGAYVVFSQNRAKPRATHAPSSRLGLVVQAPLAPGITREDDEEEVVTFALPEGSNVPPTGDTAFLSTKSGAPLITPQTLQLSAPIPTSEPVLTTGQTGPVIAPGSKIMFHVVPPSTFDSLLERKPRPVNAPGSKDLVPVIPPNWVTPPAKPEKNPAERTIVPGSKSKVPLIQVQPSANNPAKQEAAR
jgi:hypothetical protein